jgi:excinuclease ABC subunit A
MDEVTCSSCKGNRLKKESLHFKINDKNISDLAKWMLHELAIGLKI